MNIERRNKISILKKNFFFKGPALCGSFHAFTPSVPLAFIKLNVTQEVI